jgi:hypothetical protein
LHEYIAVVKRKSRICGKLKGQNKTEDRSWYETSEVGRKAEDARDVFDRNRSKRRNIPSQGNEFLLVTILIIH